MKAAGFFKDNLLVDARGVKGLWKCSEIGVESGKVNKNKLELLFMQ